MKDTIAMLKLGLIISSMFVFPLSAFAGPKVYTVNQILEAENNGKIVFCGEISDRWEPGKPKDLAANTFTAIKDKFRKRRKQLKAAKRNGADDSRIASLKKKVKRVRRTLKTGREVCALIGQGTNPAPTPTPPTNSPGGNFDMNGNLTAQGKAAFEVPASLNGNMTTGRAIYETNCTGCHGEKLNKTFTFLRFRIAQGPMFFTVQEIPDSDLADITAFLNRFQLNAAVEAK